MEASNANILHQIPQLAEQAVQAALLLETRYNDQSAADAEGIDDDGMVVIASAVLEGEENEVKAKLINLLRCYEECVNESGRKCAIDFNYARREFQQLFDIWTKIRKVYDIVKYASIWDVTSPNGGEPSLEEVHRQISETFLQHLFKAHMPLFNEAIRKLNNDTMHYRNDHPQVEPQHQGFLVPEDEGDSQAQLIYQQFDSVLDFFRDSVDRVKNGSLSVWRREQKKAMLGIGLKADMAQDLSVTRPAIALKNATLQFQDLAKIWMQIDRLLFMFCSCKSSPYIPILQKSEGCAHYLLQSSLVVDWRYQNLCQPHIVVRASTTENVTIIVKILAACDGFRTAEGLVPPFINLKESRIAAAFVKPVQMAVGLNEEIARQLSDDEIEQRASFIERAGNITHRNNSAAGVLQSNLEVDSQDKTAHALFDDVTFVLPGVRKPDPRRRKGTQQRNACTKYHIDVIANIVLNTAQTTSFIELKTISSPFSYSVAKEQDKKIYRSFVWNLLGSDPDSVSCHCQPLPSDAAKDLSLVYWGDYKDALKWQPTSQHKRPTRFKDIWKP
uniref:Uncharacterized protein n=1 Tax=Plectus sambesii TaxID=2011161 RepID=A0A914WFV8_9BILA